MGGESPAEGGRAAEAEPEDDVGETEAVNMLERDFLSGAGGDFLDRMDGTEEVMGNLEGLGDELEACPKIFLGSNLDKECNLKANRWLKIGRNPKAHVLLNNAGVSRDHCALRWDRYRRILEVRDDSTSGTLVNGEAMSRGTKIAMSHGDCITIHGKSTKFQFVVDLRPVRLALTDPKEVMRSRQEARKADQPATLSQRRRKLLSQLRHLDTTIEATGKKAFDAETAYFETVARRQLRVKEDKESEEQTTQLVQEHKELEEKLKESRKEWMRHLEEEYKKNEDGAKNIVDECASLQDKVEKLQLKKDELERSIYPERYAVADVSRGSVQPALSREGADEADVAGEEAWDGGEPAAKRLRVTEE